MRRPTKRQSSVLAQPDVDERRDTDDRYDDVADDAAEEIERGVQKRHADVGDQDGQCGRRRPLRAAWKITPPRIAVQRPWPNGASSPRTSSFRTTDGSERKS